MFKKTAIVLTTAAIALGAGASAASAKNHHHGPHFGIVIGGGPGWGYGPGWGGYGGKVCEPEFIVKKVKTKYGWKKKKVYVGQECYWAY